MLAFISPIYSLASFLWDIAKNCRPDKMPQNAASDQGLHGLLTENSIKIWIKMKNSTQRPLKQKWTGPIDR